MQLMVFFDMPVKTKKQRKNAVKFRKHLLCDGYRMIQKSVYVRYCNNKDAHEKHIRRLKKALPQEGSVYLMSLTDSQFAQNQQFRDGVLVPQAAITYQHVEEY